MTNLIHVFIVKADNGEYILDNEKYTALAEDYNDALKLAIANKAESVFFIDENYSAFSIDVATGLTEALGALNIKPGLHKDGYYNNALNFTLTVD